MSINEYTHVGFTGSRNGMTEAQHQALSNTMEGIEYATPGPIAFHHGDCVGSDAQAAEIASTFGWHIVAHPPSDDKLRAYTHSDTAREPQPYLLRNAAIVNSSELMLATPGEMKPKDRGGTWWTIRHSVDRNVRTLIVLPSGESIMGKYLLENENEESND